MYVEAKEILAIIYDFRWYFSHKIKSLKNIIKGSRDEKASCG